MQTLYENRASAAAPARAAAGTVTQEMKTNLACHRLKEHFGAHELEGLQVYRHTFPIWMRVDIQASLLNYPKSGSYPAAVSWADSSQGGSGRVILATT